MRNHSFTTEAENCRRQAADFAGKPEASFLLRIARSFDELAGQSRPEQRRNGSERRAGTATSRAR